MDQGRGGATAPPVLCPLLYRGARVQSRAREAADGPLPAEITHPILVAIHRIKQRSDCPQQLLVACTPIRIAGARRPAQSWLRLRLQGLHRLACC